MTDDTPALTRDDLETIKAALWAVWFVLQRRGEHPAAAWSHISTRRPRGVSSAAASRRGRAGR